MQSRSALVETYDELTGLPNRWCVEQLAVALSLDDKSDLVVVLMDIDFHAECSPARRDHALKTIAQRLRTCARGDDLVARMSDERFVMLLTPRIAADEETRLLSRLRAAIAEPIAEDIDMAGVSAQLGVAHCPEDGVTLDQLLLRASASMQRETVAH
jgi:diguanylate cyclase (GGDEF)-like protein